MLILIIGGSGSGKSSYAENYISELSEGCKKYYIATMNNEDPESMKKIKRHQKMRSKKGFITIEQPFSVEEALDKMEPGQERTAILEAISTLAANEIFSVNNDCRAEDKIVTGIKLLNKNLKHLLVVTDNLFEDGITYDSATNEYIRVMGTVNSRLALAADRVVEIVAGIPVTIKKGYR